MDNEDEEQDSSRDGDSDTPPAVVKQEEAEANEARATSLSAGEALRRKRLFVIQALMARANQLYREHLAAKVKVVPALARVKEEEMD
jgi:hypothetical protein